MKNTFLWISIDTLVIASSLLALSWLRTQSRKQRALLPPGPKPLPILGNFLDVAHKELWLKVDTWARTYGKITHVSIFGKSAIFLNTVEVANDLLDKRGYYYSSRPSLYVVGELVGISNLLPMQPYTDQYRRQRKLFNGALGPQQIPKYHALMEAKGITLLKDVLANPSQYLPAIRRYSGGLTLSLVYGYDAKGVEDPFLGLAEECMSLLANEIVTNGGIWPADIFPILRYIPDWFPGGSFKRKARYWRSRMEDFVNVPFRYAKRAFDNGEDQDSFCATVLGKSVNSEHLDYDLKWTANSMYAASADTTMAFMSSFFLAMCLYPETLEKAQDEIDEVIGNKRLPNLADRPDLPYVEAIYKETLRWGVPVPLGLPHAPFLEEDDIYDGVRIPKDSLIFANVWTMLRNEELFPRAGDFIPERYIGGDEHKNARLLDPRSYVFGFGRRICPGLHLVDSSAWLILAYTLATFNVRKRKDKFGNDIDPTQFVEYNNAVFRTPTNFPFDIVPRFEDEQVLQDLFGDSIGGLTSVS